MVVIRCCNADNAMPLAPVLGLDELPIHHTVRLALEFSENYAGQLHREANPDAFCLKATNVWLILEKLQIRSAP